MHRRNFGKKIFYTVLIIAFCAAFPTIATLFLNKNSNTDKVYTTKDSGKTVTVTENNTSKTLDVEEFIPCALMGQLSIDNNEELLKAFAIVLRTLIYSKFSDETSSVDAASLDLPYMTYEDMEETWKDNFVDNLNKLNKVMEETGLLVLKYNDTLIQPYYHSISAGVTRESSEEYIVPVDCPDDRENEKYLHTSVYSYETFINTVKELNSEIVLSADAPLEAFQIVSKDNAGYITELQIGGISVDVNAFLEKFSLSSLCFEVDEYNGGIRIITKGVGHGYGLSLNTAQIMGESGKNCNEILNTFYSGAVISE